MDEIEKLLHPKGIDSDEIYSKEFSQALHYLIKTHIIHPVWVGYNEIILGNLIFVLFL